MTREEKVRLAGGAGAILIATGVLILFGFHPVTPMLRLADFLILLGAAAFGTAVAHP